ncbi:MAG TPA: hypothetical protein VF628_10745 [Allosphingosinicella sp.]|jgi:hypothetical protein
MRFAETFQFKPLAAILLCREAIWPELIHAAIGPLGSNRKTNAFQRLPGRVRAEMT